MENKTIKKYPCIETTLDYETGNFIIRLWIDKTNSDDDTVKSSETIAYLRGLTDGFWHHDSIFDLLIEKLSKIPNINAFQIKEKAKDGISWGTVVYTVYFSEDVHG